MIIAGVVERIESTDSYEDDERYDELVEILDEYFDQDELEYHNIIEINSTNFRYRYQLRNMFEKLADYVEGEFVVVSHPISHNLPLNIIVKLDKGRVEITNYGAEDTVSGLNYEGGKW